MAEYRQADASRTVINYHADPERPAPKMEVGALAWLRNNLFGSPADLVITVLASLLVLVLVLGFLNWSVRSANWFVVINNQRLFMMQSFERGFEWRIALTVLLSALLTGVSFAAWARASVRLLTTITLAVMVVIVALPPIIEAALPQPDSYLTAGNVDIVDRASKLRPQGNLAFIAQAGETVSLRMAAQETSDVETLSALAGFSDRAANALANAANNRLEQVGKTGDTFDRMIKGELTEPSEERTRLVIRTFTRTNDMAASTSDYARRVGERLSTPDASIRELKVWLDRLTDAVNAQDERDQAILDAAAAVEGSIANVTADERMPDDARALVGALSDALRSGAQLEDLGETLVLHLSEDLIGLKDQRDDEEELIQPTRWEADFLRDMFVRLLTPQAVTDIYRLGETPMQVAIHDGESLAVLAEGVLSADGGSLTYVIPRDGWYVLSKNAAAGEEGSAILAARGIFPIVERTLSATESLYARVTDNELEVSGGRPQIDGKAAPTIALIDNQFRGQRQVGDFLTHFIPLFFEQVERLLLPFFITVAWGYLLGRALSHMLGENSIFNSGRSRATALAASFAPLLILLAYFALLDGAAPITGLPGLALKIAAVFGVVALARRIESWLNRANAGEDAQATITRQLVYSWGIYPFVMFVLASGIGGFSGATLGSMAGGLIWLFLMALIGRNFQGPLGYVLLLAGFFLQIAQARVLNTVWEGWTQDSATSLLIWLVLAAIGIGLGWQGMKRRGGLSLLSKRIGYMVSCLAFLFVFVDTNLLAAGDNASSTLLAAAAIALWLGWMFFGGVVRWTTNRIIIGLLLLTFLWMQTWTAVDRWSIVYFIVWMAAGAFAFKRGVASQTIQRKLSDARGGPIFDRYPLASMGALVLAWLIALLLIPSVVLGLESQNILQSSAHDLLPLSDKRLWGGLMLTMQLTILGVGASFPIGLALALGRRSKLPVVHYACVLYIETVRGVPLITVLFMATLLVPLVDPTLAAVEQAVRAWVGITLFSAAYLAENVRGGLQSIGVGQTEAAQAIGLSGWQTTIYILLPQALRAVIPALVGQFISLYKDTSLVVIIGLADITGVAQRVVAQAEFVQRRQETFLYVAIIYFVFSYIMSYISRRVEETGSGAARAQGL